MSPEAAARLGRWFEWLDKRQGKERAVFERAMQAWERGDDPPEGNDVPEVPEVGSHWKNPAGRLCEVLHVDVGPLDVGQIVTRTRVHVLFPGPSPAQLVVGLSEFHQHYTKA